MEIYFEEGQVVSEDILEKMQFMQFSQRLLMNWMRSGVKSA